MTLKITYKNRHILKPTNSNELSNLIKNRIQININAKRHCDLHIIKNFNGKLILKRWSNCSSPIEKLGYQLWWCPNCKCQLAIGKRK